MKAPSPRARETAVHPLRIFLSYGHDRNKELVRRIKADLEARGHDVWFDKSKIKSGHDWRRYITDGIMDSHRVLSFLSKYSTRDPGVCLDEVGIAVGVKGGSIQTVLVESEEEVRPPASISHIQWLDMHDWKKRHSEDGTEWDEWYKKKLDEIIAVVESDESRRFAGEIGTLAEYLKPISSDSRMFALLKRGLVGRTWLVDAIEEWRNADRASRLFWIMGAPGVGKSAFAAHLAHYGRDKVVAVQFCEYDKPDHKSAVRIVRTLAFQIATRLPDYRKLLLTLPEIRDLDRKNPSELFDYLLANPLRHAIDGGRERYLIVIDALDEAVDGGRNPLVELLARDAQRLPDWLGIVVTSRPEFDVTGPLQGFKPFVLDTATESNRSDIREYLRRELAPQLRNRPDAERLVEQILEKSEGVFLYVERFCDDLQRDHLSVDRAEEFPQGLGGIFSQYFQRQFPDLEEFRKVVRPALRAILAAREPLPLEILQRLFNWQDEELHDFTRTLGSLFPTTAESGNEVIKPYHKSLADWLADEVKAGPFFVSALEGHRLLAMHGESRLAALSGEGIPRGADSYWSRSLLSHCCKSANWDSAVRCIAEPALFWRLSPASYGLSFSQGAFSSVPSDALVAPVLESMPSELRGEIGWMLATAFADRAKDLQTSVFAFAKRHDQSPNAIRNHLKQAHPREFDQLRDTIYLFTQTARVTAEFACAVLSKQVGHEYALRSFLDRFAGIPSYLHYLSHFASTEGWSGALEDEASAARIPWERLFEFAKGSSLGAANP